MNTLRHSVALWAAVSMATALTACGGGGGGNTTPPPTTYTLTVNTSNPASGVSIAVTPADNSGLTNGTSSFTRTYNAGTVITLTAPSAAGNNSFGSWSGCTTASTVTCKVTISANTSVTATFESPKTTPTITVTPSLPAITTAQELSVAVAVSGSGNPLPTGSVTLTSATYSSSPTALASGSANIIVPAGSLAVGSNALTATYTPDSASSSVYNSASGVSSSVTVTPVTSSVTIDQLSIGPAVSDRLMGMNMAAWYDPTTSAIIPAFQTAGITIVRWPGGSWSDDYHWATNTMCGNYPNGNATFTNFVNDLVLPGNFDVSLTANYGTNATCNGPGDPTEAAAWIAKAKSINAHITYMTVGNEVYGSWEDDKHLLKNDAGTYAAAVGMASTNGYYALIKAADPSVLVGVDVNPGNYPPWDPIVLANAQYDFVEYHYYPQAPGSESDTFLVRQAAQGLTTAINTIKSELATAGKAGTPIYVGEIGSVYTNPGKQSLSITQGLYAGQVLGEMMNDGIARASWWIGFGNCNGTSGNLSSSLYGWQNFGGYNIFADGPTDTPCAGAGPIGTLSPTARAFQLFSKVAVNGESVLSANVLGDTTNVRAYAATNSGGTALVLFNLSPVVNQQVVVSLSSQTVSSDVTFETYSKALYDESKDGIWADPTFTDLGSQNLPLTLNLDPWSMNVVIIK